MKKKKSWGLKKKKCQEQEEAGVLDTMNSMVVMGQQVVREVAALVAKVNILIVTGKDLELLRTGMVEEELKIERMGME
jgi:hypothetical protein